MMGIQAQWNREDTERTTRKIAVGGQLTWSDEIKYTQKTAELAIAYDQTPLNHFVREVYGTINNYEAITLRGLRKGVIKHLEDQIIYGDFTYGTLEPDGLHAWAEDGNPTSDTSTTNIDEGGVLSLANLRSLEDEMKYGIDFLVMPFLIARQIDQFYHEGGYVLQNYNNLGSFVWAKNDIGARVPWWNGIEIIRSDYMVAEEAGTGEGSDAKAKFSTGTAEYSIFAVKMGQVMEGEGGVTLGFGGENHDAGEIFKTVFFPNLEGYDAAGIRVVAYSSMLAGSSMAVGRIHGITAGAITP